MPGLRPRRLTALQQLRALPRRRCLRLRLMHARQRRRRPAPPPPPSRPHHSDGDSRRHAMPTPARPQSRRRQRLAATPSRTRLPLPASAAAADRSTPRSPTPTAATRRHLRRSSTHWPTDAAVPIFVRAAGLDFDRCGNHIQYMPGTGSGWRSHPRDDRRCASASAHSGPMPGHPARYFPTSPPPTRAAQRRNLSSVHRPTGPPISITPLAFRSRNDYAISSGKN